MLQVIHFEKKRIVKCLIVLTVMFTQVFVLGMVQVFAQARPFTHYFPDRAFAQAVASHMGRNIDSGVTEQELRQLPGNVLDARNRGIRSVEGAHYLGGVLTINLSNNHISDLAPFGGEIRIQNIHAQNQTINLPVLLNTYSVEIKIANSIGISPQNTANRPYDTVSGTGWYNWQRHVINWNGQGQNSLTWSMGSRLENHSWGTFSGTVRQEVIMERLPNDGVLYSVDQNKLEATVTGYNGTDKNVIIPSTVRSHGYEYTVRHIGAFAFHNKQISKVQLPNTLTSIGNNAFSSNQLTEINLPDGNLTSIGSNAFLNNKLTNLEIPFSVFNIESQAFMNNQITNIVIKNTESYAQFGHAAFTSNPLEYITVPTGSAARMINILKFTMISVKTTPILREGTVNKYVWEPHRNNWKMYGEEPTEGLHYNLDHTRQEATLTRYSGHFVDIIIPETITNNNTEYTVTGIGHQVFMDRDITSVRIPNTVKTIGNFAFYGTELTHVEIPSSVTDIGNYAFYGNRLLTSINIPKSIRSVGIVAFGDTPLESINVPIGTAQNMAPLLRNGMLAPASNIPGVTTNTILYEGATPKYRWNGSDNWVKIN